MRREWWWGEEPLQEEHAPTFGSDLALALRLIDVPARSGGTRDD